MAENTDSFLNMEKLSIKLLKKLSKREKKLKKYIKSITKEQEKNGNLLDIQFSKEVQKL